MTVIETRRPVGSPEVGKLTLPALVRQVAVMVRRNTLHLRRMPEMLMDATAQPVVMVLMFGFVFGGAIQPPAAEHGYRDWLLPGIMGQTIAWSSSAVAVGLATDIQRGMVDRLRSLPIGRSVLLLGRSVSGLIHAAIGIAVMSITGLIVGWRPHKGVGETLLGFALLLLWGLAMVWIGVLVGAGMRSVEAVNGLMLTAVFPITFVANTYAPPETMPRVLQVVAEWNPMSALVQSVRELWGNAAPAGADAALPLQHPIQATLIWTVGLILLLAPLALRVYRQRTST